MRSTKLRLKKTIASVVLAAAVIVPAAVSSAEPAAHPHGHVRHADKADDKARDVKKHEADLSKDSTTSTWNDPSLIDNGGLKYG